MTTQELNISMLGDSDALYLPDSIPDYCRTDFDITDKTVTMEALTALFEENLDLIQRHYLEYGASWEREDMTAEWLAQLFIQELSFMDEDEICERLTACPAEQSEDGKGQLWYWFGT